VYNPATGELVRSAAGAPMETVQGQMARNQFLLALSQSLGALSPERIAALFGPQAQPQNPQTPVAPPPPATPPPTSRPPGTAPGETQTYTPPPIDDTPPPVFAGGGTTTYAPPPVDARTPALTPVAPPPTTPTPPAPSTSRMTVNGMDYVRHPTDGSWYQATPGMTVGAFRWTGTGWVNIND